MGFGPGVLRHWYSWVWKGHGFGAFALPAYCEFPWFFGWLTSLGSFGLP
jgi:hypothetical protein